MDTILHLFDHTVKPVLLCGSEIWGTSNTLSANVKKSGFNILIHLVTCHLKSYISIF